MTSPTGAVIRDILHRLADRFPRRVLVWPVRVQGDGSAAEVAEAIRGFNALPRSARRAGPRPELIIVARGGGSLEDLWSFNEEIVVRAAAESIIPLISAVGHETDITLIDFVADRRAPTPTAAAEMAVPVRVELLLSGRRLARRSLACWPREHDHRRTELRAAVRALPSPRVAGGAAPAPRLPPPDCRARSRQCAGSSRAYSRVGGRLAPQLLRLHVERRRERFAGMAHRLRAGLAARIAAEAQAVSRAAANASALGVRAARASASSSISALCGSSARASCSPRSPIKACWRAALRWCAPPGDTRAQRRSGQRRHAARHRVRRRPRRRHCRWGEGGA